MSGRLFPRATYPVRVYPWRNKASHHRSSRNRATSEFQVRIHVAIGYRELAGPLTSIPRGNLTLITLRLITVRSAWFWSRTQIRSSLLWFRPRNRGTGKRRKGRQRRRATVEWKWKFHRKNFTGQRVTVKFSNSVTGWDKRAKRGRTRKHDIHGKNNFMRVPAKSFGKWWKSSIKVGRLSSGKEMSSTSCKIAKLWKSRKDATLRGK